MFTANVRATLVVLAAIATHAGWILTHGGIHG